MTDARLRPHEMLSLYREMQLIRICEERLAKSLDELNHDVYGGAEKLGQPDASTEPTADSGTSEAPVK